MPPGIYDHSRAGIYPPELVRQVREVYGSGHGLHDTARLTGTTVRILIRLMDKNGIERRPRGPGPNARGAPRGPGNGSWRGDQCSYKGMHSRVYRARGKASAQPCAHCGGQARDWAAKHGEDPGLPSSYLPLCKPCHKTYDAGSQFRKLTIEQVRDIRTRHEAGETIATLARELDVAEQTVRLVVQGRTWWQS